jgi:hypothetical protein
VRVIARLDYVFLCARCKSDPQFTILNFDLQAAGSRITAFLDNVTLATLTDTSSSYGMAAVGSGWHVAYFQNFAVRNNTAL